MFHQNCEFLYFCRQYIHMLWWSDRMHTSIDHTRCLKFSTIGMVNRNVAVLHVKLLATARDITIALNRWLFAFNQAKSTAFLWPLVCKLVFPNFLRRLKLSGQLSWKLLLVAQINGAGEVSWLNEVVLTPQVREALFRLRGVGIRKGWEVQWLPQTPENPSLPLRFDQCWPRYLRFADDVLLSAFERRFD